MNLKKTLNKNEWRTWDRMLIVYKNMEGFFVFRMNGLVDGTVIISKHSWVDFKSCIDYMTLIPIYEMKEMTTGKLRNYRYDVGVMDEVL